MTAKMGLEMSNRKKNYLISILWSFGTSTSVSLYDVFYIVCYCIKKMLWKKDDQFLLLKFHSVNNYYRYSDLDYSGFLHDLQEAGTFDQAGVFPQAL